MTGSCWRLLAALWLIFAAPTGLRGQDRGEGPIPLLARKLVGLRAFPPSRPGRIPVSPNLPPQFPGIPGTTIFTQMVNAAGTIFSGRVTAIGRVPLSPGQAASSTTITFQVERAMRGVSAGETLTIHEWAGLWTSRERYRVGESVLLFLYPPGKLGLTSPVAGPMGRFAMDSQGRILMNGQHSASLVADPILGGKTVIPYADFALAVRRSSREE
jgi:hypothetical protein